MGINRIKRIIKAIAVCLLVIFNLNVFSQIERSDMIEEIGGTNYFIHKIEKGNTLYSLSRIYETTIDVIIAENPSAELGLSIGEYIKIPVVNAGSSNTTQTEFHSHVVLEKETLYSLSRMYDVTVKEITDSNPNLADGLKAGDTILIPNKNISLSTETIVPEEAMQSIISLKQDSLITHQVEKGETLYSLSKRYDVSIDEIKDVNASFEYVKEGQTIRIPKLKPDWNNSAEYNAVISDSSIQKKEYKAALFLPFYLDMNDTSQTHSLVHKADIYPKSQIAIQFYEGALLAIDSIKKMGHNITLLVYDIENDTIRLNEIFRKPEFHNVDIIIGPLHGLTFDVAAKYANKHKISIVCPVPRTNKVLLSNEYVSKVFSSYTAQMEIVANYVVTNYPDSHIVVFSSKEENDVALAKVFLESRKKTLLLKGESFYKPAYTSVFDKIKIDSLKSKLNSKKPNIVIIPSNDQAFVTDILTKLYSYCNDYSITVFGTSKWEQFDNIDIDYLHGLKVHYTVPMHLDYEKSSTQEYLEKFKNKYKTEPDKYGVTGFDITFYYLSALCKYGTAFRYHLPEYKRNLVGYSFDFQKTGVESGYENKYSFILKHENYRLISVN